MRRAGRPPQADVDDWNEYTPLTAYEGREIRITPDGMFVSLGEDGNLIQADSIGGIKERIRVRTRRKKTKLDIPVAVWDSSNFRTEVGKLRLGSVTGVHESNRNYLVKWLDSKDIDQRHTCRNFLRLPSQALRDQYTNLKVAQYKADKAAQAFERRYEINVEAEVSKALQLTKEQEWL